MPVINGLFWHDSWIIFLGITTHKKSNQIKRRKWKQGFSKTAERKQVDMNYFLFSDSWEKNFPRLLEIFFLSFFFLPYFISYFLFIVRGIRTFCLFFSILILFSTVLYILFVLNSWRNMDFLSFFSLDFFLLYFIFHFSFIVQWIQTFNLFLYFFRKSYFISSLWFNQYKLFVVFNFFFLYFTFYVFFIVKGIQTFWLFFLYSVGIFFLPLVHEYIFNFSLFSFSITFLNTSWFFLFPFFRCFFLWVFFHFISFSLILNSY